MADIGINGADPHDEIVRLEAQIDALADKLESCRKFILAGQRRRGGGEHRSRRLLFGAITFDPAIMACAAAALLGGFVAWGSNRSTANETSRRDRRGRSRRAELIGQIQLRVIEGGATLH